MSFGRVSASFLESDLDPSNDPYERLTNKDNRMSVPSVGDWSDVGDVKAEIDEEEDNTGTIFSSISTLANSAIGAGVLAFPYAFQNAGLGVALILTLALGCIMGYSLNVICKAMQSEQHMHCKTYNTLVRSYFGPNVGAVFEVVLIFYLFGSCIGYNIIVYDMVQPVMEQLYSNIGDQGDVFYKVVIKANAFSSRAIIIGVLSITITLPLSLLRKISALKFSSALAVFSVVYMSCVVSVKSIKHVVEEGTGQNLSWVINSAAGVANAVPLLCFAFQCQVNVPPIYSEMKKELRTVASFNKVSVAAYALCFAIYLPCGICGYMYFGDLTQSDILKSGTVNARGFSNGFAQDDVAVLLGRVCIMCAVLCCYPLNHYPARFAIYSLLYSSEKQAVVRPRDALTTPELSSAASPTSHPLHDTARWHRYFYIETSAYVLLTYIIAVLVKDLSYIMDICGSTCATVVIFIIPSQFLRRREGITGIEKFLSSVLLVVGVTIMVVCLATTILRMAGVRGFEN